MLRRCGEIDFEAFLRICIDKSVFDSSVGRTAKGSPLKAAVEVSPPQRVSCSVPCAVRADGLLLHWRWLQTIRRFAPRCGRR